MPVGAIVGATAVSAGTSLITSGRQARAAERAADAQVEAADRSAEVNREIYYDQAGRLEPFRGLGLAAINPMAQLMGLDYQYGGQGGGQSYIPANDSNLTSLGSQRFNAQSYLQANPDVMEAYRPGLHGANSPQAFAQLHWNTHGRVEGRPGAYGAPRNSLQALGAAQPANESTNPLEALQSRPGYQFRLQQGNDAYEASAAARGLGNSGAQLRALAQYNQDYASNEFDKEFNRLNALMGGGQVATGQINQAAGAYGANAANAYMNAGNARASGYINQANAWSNGINGVGNAIGGGLGYLGGQQGWWGT